MDEKKKAFLLYEQLLSDLDGGVVKQAVLMHIAESKFFPKIAEIRERAIKASLPSYPLALDAWQAVTTGDKSNAIANKVFAALKIDDFDLRQMRTETLVWQRKTFCDAYDQQVNRIREQALIPASVRLYQQQITGQASSQQLPKPDRPIIRDEPISAATRTVTDAKQLTTLIERVHGEKRAKEEREQKERENETRRRLQAQKEKILRENQLSEEVAGTPVSVH